MPPKATGKKTKSPPILSQEFLIKNHGDIASCSVIILLIALMFQATQPFAAKFISLHHNVTIEGVEHVHFYTTGPIDLLAVVFYMLLAIVMHAFVQEFILDKLNRKMHLSKIKHSKFNESGQLLTFYLLSIAWAFAIMHEDDYFGNFHKLWAAYPHNALSWRTKMFMIAQMSYWLHWYPELYLQKVKKEEVPDRITYISLYLAAVVGAYFLSFSPLAVVFLFVHYIGEAIFQATRLVYFAERNYLARYGFMIWNVVFPLVRLSIAGLSIFIFFYRLEATVLPKVDFATGNFNTRSVRLVCLAFLELVQMWLLYRFVTFFLRHRRERSSRSRSAKNKSMKAAQAAVADKGSEPESSGEMSSPVAANGDAGVSTRRRK